MSDFVTNELIEIDVEGRIFKIRELTGTEVDEIYDSSIYFEDGKTMISIVKQNEGYLKAVVDAPYEQWKTVQDKEKIDFLNTLRSPIRAQLVDKIKKYHSSFGDALKK